MHRGPPFLSILYLSLYLSHAQTSHTITSHTTEHTHLSERSDYAKVGRSWVFLNVCWSCGCAHSHPHTLLYTTDLRELVGARIHSLPYTHTPTPPPHTPMHTTTTTTTTTHTPWSVSFNAVRTWSRWRRALPPWSALPRPTPTSAQAAVASHPYCCPLHGFAH
jgi:hypothetical protein